MVSEAQKKANKKYRKMNKDKINQLQLGIAKNITNRIRMKFWNIKKNIIFGKNFSRV